MHVANGLGPCGSSSLWLMTKGGNSLDGLQVYVGFITRYFYSANLTEFQNLLMSPLSLCLAKDAKDSFR